MAFCVGVSGPLRSGVGNFELQCENSLELNLCLKAQHSCCLVSFPDRNYRFPTGNVSQGMIVTDSCIWIFVISWQRQDLSARSKWTSDVKGRGKAVGGGKIITRLSRVKRKQSVRAGNLEEVNCVITSLWSCDCRFHLVFLFLFLFFIPLFQTLSIWAAASWQQTKGTSVIFEQTAADRQVGAGGSGLFGTGHEVNESLCLVASQPLSSLGSPVREIQCDT